MSAAFDVVVVPDFSGRASLTFEARTLYLLASWLEHVGDSRLPLHLACIGEPPPTVRALAAKARAAITVHAPAPANHGVYANKLRGFEVPLQTDRMLLIDADILVLGDPSPLADGIPRDAISAAASHGAIILPEMWEELYARLALPVPARTMLDFHRTLGAATPGVPMLHPSWNSGVVLVPGRSDLREIWLAHLEVLGALRPAWTQVLKPVGMLVGDEPALATALAILRERGAPIVTLPDAGNVRWRNLYRRAPTLADATLFHMMGSFIAGETLAERLDPRRHAYELKMLRRYTKRWVQHGASRPRDAVRYLAPAAAELRRFRPLLRGLYERHIRPVV